MRFWKKNEIVPLLAPLLLLLSAACARRAPAPAPESFAPTWNWVDFPRSERLALGAFAAVLESAQMEVIKAPREGWFMLDAAFAGAKDADAPVAAGREIGRMAPGTEPLDAEADALHAKLADVEAQLRLLREEEAKETFADQERQARRDITLYEAALKLADDPALRRDILPQADAASREEIGRIQGRLAAAKERLEKTHAAGDRQAALQKRQVELADAKAAFERARKAERDTVKAPFAGRLRFAVPFEPTPPATEPAGKRAYVRADATLAVLRDDAALWAKVELGEASLLSVPADQLLFSFVAAGEPVEAPFGGRAAEAGNRPTPVYQFAVAQATPQQVRLVGGVVSGQLVQKLPRAAYIVPKIRLQVYRSDAFAGGDWAADCARVFPGCQVLAVGRDAVALVPGPVLGEGQ